MSRFVRSIYIPRVLPHLSPKQVASILSREFELGEVARAERIPQQDTKTGKPYFKYYIYFDNWFTGPNADAVAANCDQGEPTKMYYSEKNFWWICPNTSDLQQFADCPPKHISLACYLPADISVETVHTVMEGLDVGKIHCIHYASDTTTDNVYSEHRWPYSNPTLWEKVVRLPMRQVTVHYAYWYRTRSAIAIQQLIHAAGYADVPVYPDMMTWTFYPEKPITDGVSPHVWVSVA
jgi:hypothetical protein